MPLIKLFDQSGRELELYERPATGMLTGEVFAGAGAADQGLAGYHAYLLVTAFPQARRPPAIDELLLALAVPVLHKPFAMDALLTEVERAAQRLASGPRVISGDLPSLSAPA